MSVGTTGDTAAPNTPQSKAVTEPQLSRDDSSEHRQSSSSDHSPATHTDPSERDVVTDERTTGAKKWAYRILSVVCIVAIAAATAYVLVLSAFLRHVSTQRGPDDM